MHLVFFLQLICLRYSTSLASVYAFKACVELTGPGNILAAMESYDNLRCRAEKADSNSLRLFHAAASSYCLLWLGRLSDIEMLLADAAVFIWEKGNFIILAASGAVELSHLHAKRGDIDRARKYHEKASCISKRA
jgi:hypothetical protein